MYMYTYIIISVILHTEVQVLENLTMIIEKHEYK